MENKELYNIFPELGHEVFEVKIKKTYGALFAC
jgi:hypothetical protein